MKLPGRLRVTTLGDVFGALHRAAATGTLELLEIEGPTSGRRHAVEFEAGLVAGVDTPLPCSRLGEILRSEGFLAEAAVRRLLARMQQDPARPCGELLVEEALVTRDLVQAALRHQLRLKVDVLFRLGDARLGFRVPRPRSKPAEQPLPLSPREFLYGRERARLRRWAPAASAPAWSAPPPAARRPAPDPAAFLDPARRRALAALGLDAGADRDSVQRAFRRLAVQYHPDRFPHASGPEQSARIRRFAELSAAYHLLVA
jgi:DnaJ-domain-containing protein 1